MYIETLTNIIVLINEEHKPVLMRSLCSLRKNLRLQVKYTDRRYTYLPLY